MPGLVFLIETERLRRHLQQRADIHSKEPTGIISEAQMALYQPKRGRLFSQAARYLPTPPGGVPSPQELTLEEFIQLELDEETG